MRRVCVEVVAAVVLALAGPVAAEAPANREVVRVERTEPVTPPKVSSREAPVAPKPTGDAAAGGPSASIVDTATVLAAGSSTSRTLAARFAETVNVIDHGAIPNDGRPDDAAFVSAQDLAFAHASADRNKRIHVPAGEYLITRPNVFNAWTAATPYRQGVMITGDGMYATKITFRPAVAGAYMYDGEAFPGRRLMYLTVRDLALYTDASAGGGPVNLFKQLGTAKIADQAFTFENVRFEDDWRAPAAKAGTILRIAGGINGSENKFLHCRGYYWKHVIHSTNPQAVNHYVVGSDFELQRGDFFYFEGGRSSGAGGQLQVFGGSFIFHGTGGEASVLRVEGATGSTFNFIGIRTETYNPRTIYYRVEGVNNFPRINVIGAEHYGNAAGVSQVLARINSMGGTRLVFEKCNLQDQATPWKVQFVNSQGTPGWFHSMASGASVTINDSEIPTHDVGSLVTWGANAEGGLFRVRNASTYYRVVDTGTPAYATDVDLTGPAGWSAARMVNPVHLKSFSGYVGYWPLERAGWDGDNARIVLPLGVILKSIKVRKVAETGDPRPYQLRVVNGEGVPWGASKPGTRNEEHSVMLDDLYKLIATEADRVIKLDCRLGVSCGGAHHRGMGPGEMFIVEYY